MQHELIKGNLPDYILSGYKKAHPWIATDTFRGNRENLESFIAKDQTWKSLTVFEFPKIPILDLDSEDLNKYRYLKQHINFFM